MLVVFDEGQLLDSRKRRRFFEHKFEAKLGVYGVLAIGSVVPPRSVAFLRVVED